MGWIVFGSLASEELERWIFSVRRPSKLGRICNAAVKLVILNLEQRK